MPCTTVTKYSLIENKSFKLGKGERGEGAYFWGDDIYAKKLAVAWYINETRRGRYSKDKNKNCAVIWVKLKASKDETIDLNEHECRYNLLKLQKEKGFEDNREDAHKLYDEFYDLVEKNLGYELKIVITEVYPPRLKGLKGLNIFPTQTCGMARCFVVRDPLCISILSCDRLAYFNTTDNEAVIKVLKDIENET